MSTGKPPDRPGFGPIFALLPLALTERRRLAWSAVAGVLSTSAGVTAGALGAYLVGEATTGTPSDELVWSVLALALSVLAAAALLWWYMYAVHDFAYSLLAVLRVRVFEALIDLAPRFLSGRRTGEIAATAMGDVESTERFFAHALVDYAIAIVVTLSATACLLFIHPLLGALLPPVALSMGTVPFWLARRADAEGQRWRSQLGTLNADVVDGVQGLRELLAFGRGEAHAKLVDERTAGLQSAQLRYGRRAGLEHAATDTFAALGSLLMLAAASWLVSTDRIDVALYPVAVVITVYALFPLAQVSEVARELGEVSASARRIQTVVEHPPAVVDTANAVPAQPPAWTIAFDEVWFSYDADRPPALRGVTFDVAQGEVVALVGASGAGKSTCTNLLLRLWDVDRGAVRLGGVDLRKWPETAVRDRISIVPQDVYLFNASIRDNIRLGRLDATDDEVERAARAAVAHDFIIEELPVGYDTVSGERGAELSGGQRQRIAIARALLKDAPVLVMDEAVSNLDAETETQLRLAMQNAAHGRTTLLVAHRLSTIRSADRIVVLEHGRVVENGTHDSLLAAAGTYSTLIARQDGLVV